MYIYTYIHTHTPMHTHTHTHTHTGEHHSCQNGGFFALAIMRTVVDDAGQVHTHLDISAALPVPSELWAHGPARDLASWIADGTCPAYETQV